MKSPNPEIDPFIEELYRRSPFKQISKMILNEMYLKFLRRARDEDLPDPMITVNEAFDAVDRSLDYFETVEELEDVLLIRYEYDEARKDPYLEYRREELEKEASELGLEVLKERDVSKLRRSMEKQETLERKVKELQAERDYLRKKREEELPPTPPAVRTYAELVKGFEEKDPWDVLAIFVSRFEGFLRDYSTEDLHRFLRELRERTSTESIYRFYKIYPQLRDDFVSIASRIGWIPPAPPTPLAPPKPPRRPPPTRLRPEEVEEVWEQFLAFAGAVGIEATLATTYRDRFVETIRTSPTVANAIERARRLISSVQRELRPPPPTAPPIPRIAPAEEEMAEVYRRLGVPFGAPISRSVFEAIWSGIQREREPPKGLVRSELDYLWREFADFLKKFDMDPERHRPEFDAVINPDFNLVENLDTVMKKVHELTDSERWGPERWL